jgi:hypothetical protein
MVINLAAITDHNHETHYYEFAIEDASELDLLPTLTDAGKQQFSTIGAICEGSLAITADLTPYRLTQSGWVGV